MKLFAESLGESVMEIVEVKNEEEIRRKVGGTPTELSIRDR